MKIKIRQIEDGCFLARCNEAGQLNHIFAFDNLDRVAKWIGKQLLSAYYDGNIKDYEMLEIIADAKASDAESILDSKI